MEDIYLETLAAELGVSAKHLLAETGLTIQNVMEQTGFVSRATFLRSFRKHVDISPSAFRMIHNPTIPQESDDEQL